MFYRQTIRDFDLKGKRVLLRADYNVPLKDGQVADDFRIKQSLPTVKYLLEQGCSVVICSHLGRPEGQPNPEFSLRPVADRLSDLLGQPVQFADDCVGEATEAAAQALQSGEILLLENLRFHPEEEENGAAFAAELASLAEVFVQDGFGVVHRAHASTEAVTKYLPSVAGLLLESEVSTIRQVMEDPKRPLMTVMGGAKIADKIELLEKFVEVADIIAIGGAMANTFLAAQNQPIGNSLFEEDQLETAKKILADAQAKSKQFLLPVDVITTDRVGADGETQHATLEQVGHRDIIADIGPATVQVYGEAVARAGTIIWNGPVGVTEFPQYSEGSIELGKQIAASEAFSLLGGGDTAAFVEQAGMASQFDFISTGGGASLELMAGRKLPGVEALLAK